MNHLVQARPVAAAFLPQVMEPRHAARAIADLGAAGSLIDLAAASADDARRERAHRWQLSRLQAAH